MAQRESVDPGVEAGADLAMAFKRVAALAEIPEAEGLAVRSAGIRVGLFLIADEVYAMENLCPHANASLVGGELQGCVIFCPVHQWDFDVRTGLRPGYSDGIPIPCFAVDVREDEVWVDVEHVINRPMQREQASLSPRIWPASRATSLRVRPQLGV